MRKIIGILILLCMIGFQESFAASGVILKPNLMAQMKLQTIQDKKVANMQRLAILRANKKTPSTTQASGPTQQTQRSKNNTTKTSISKPPQKIQLASQPSISSVDMDQVRTDWLSWYNTHRSSLGLGTYTYDSRLDATAYSWNREFANGKWQNHHRRSPWDSYYSYPIITEWFKDRGVVAKVINGVTTTENVGFGVYRCSSGDCTNALINSIRSTFDFFMSEKSYNWLHYRSIVQPNFSKVWLSVVVVPEEGRYYLTMHFVTELQ